MRFQIVILEQVFEEINTAALYYEKKGDNLGKQLLEDWEKTIRSIQEIPELYEKKYKNFRQGMLDRFPYLVIFEIEAFDIVVYRFMHAHRNPKKVFAIRK